MPETLPPFDSDLFQQGSVGPFPDMRILDSGEPGPTVGLMGMLHGNEPAGIGLWRLMQDMGLPKIGRVVLILGHPAALREGVRYIGHDLNRMFVDEAELDAVGVDRQGPAYKRLQELRAFLPKLDVLLDLHTTSLPTAPFAIFTSAKAERLCPELGMPLTIIQNLDAYVSGTAVQWLAAAHGRIATTVEVGSHDDPEGPRRAYLAGLSILRQLDMVPKAQNSVLPAPIAAPPRRIEVCGHVPDVEAGFSYRRNFRNFERLEPGEIIGKDSTRTYRAPLIDRPVIIMPASASTLREGSNTDAFFFGREITKTAHNDDHGLAKSA